MPQEATSSMRDDELASGKRRRTVPASRLRVSKRALTIARAARAKEPH